MSGSKSGKVPALKYAVPGAATGWHAVPGLGVFHPDIPVPVDEQRAKKYIDAHKRQVAEAKEQWEAFEAERQATGQRPAGPIPFGTPAAGKEDGVVEYLDPPCPVELVRVSESQAEEGRDAQLQARGRSLRNLRGAREGTPDEQVMAHEEAAALAGGEEG